MKAWFQLALSPSGVNWPIQILVYVGVHFILLRATKWSSSVSFTVSFMFFFCFSFFEKPLCLIVSFLLEFLVLYSSFDRRKRFSINSVNHSFSNFFFPWKIMILIMIGSPRAFLWRNRHAITWFFNYRCPLL